MYGFTSPGAAAAMMWHRYRYEYNAPEDGLAAVAINNRKNGAFNSNAVFQKPITYDEYMSARFIAEPLRLFDYCIINDGGVSFIVTTPEKARTLKHPPAYIGATYAASNLNHNYHVQDFWWKACQDISRRLYKEANVTPSEIKVAEVYDNFTPTIVFALEGFGFCERGKGHEWVRDGRIELGGQIPGEHVRRTYLRKLYAGPCAHLRSGPPGAWRDRTRRSPTPTSCSTTARRRSPPRRFCIAEHHRKELVCDRYRCSSRPKPIPPIFKVNQGFWEGSKIGELRLDHCTRCDHIWFPPSNSCPKCLSTDVD